MLTEKCPSCGSYNDPTAAECYFCKKELPSTGKQKKKKRAPQKSADTSSTIASTPQRINHPGCLMLYIFFLFIFAVGVTLLLINASGGYYVINLPPEYADYTSFISDVTSNPKNGDLTIILTQVLPIFGALLAVTLGFGLFLLQRWARALALLVQALLSIAFMGYFYVLLSQYYVTSDIQMDFVIVFVLTLLSIIISMYGFVWFFERSRIFGPQMPRGR